MGQVLRPKVLLKQKHDRTSDSTKSDKLTSIIGGASVRNTGSDGVSMTHGSKSENHCVVNIGGISLSNLVGSSGTINVSDNGDRIIILNLYRRGLGRNRLSEKKRKCKREHDEKGTDITEEGEVLYSTSINP